MYYTEKFTFSEDAFLENGNILPFHILKVFEDAATAHGELIGVGENRMKELNLYWIISQLKYKVLKNISKGEELTIKTWPIKPGGIGFLREYLILDKNGDTVIMGSANWLTIGREDRKLKIGQKVFPPMEFSDEINFSNKIPRLRDFPGGEYAKSIIPESFHIDSNGHVNNKHYTSFIKNAIGGFIKAIDTFQIDYVQEIMPEDEVDMIVLKNENEVLIKGENKDKKHFYAKIEYK